MTWFTCCGVVTESTLTLSNEKKREGVNTLVMLFYIVSCFLVTAMFGWTASWLDTGEAVLVGYIFIQIVCIAFC